MKTKGTDHNKEKMVNIHLGNVTLIAQQLLNADVSTLLIHDDKKFDLDIQHLRELLHTYRYASAQQRPQGFSTIDWIEQIANELLQQTQYCLEQLTTKAQRQLSEQVNALHLIEHQDPIL